MQTRAYSDPTPEDEDIVAKRDSERAIESVTGWHYVTMMRGRMPRESHVQWATRVLGREIQFMDECTAGECETLKADLREAEKDGQRED
jgi:hypothetical protein